MSAFFPASTATTDAAPASVSVDTNTTSTSTPTMTSSEGRVRFDSFPDDTFRYTLASDKLEAVIGLESKKTKQKWECRADDAEFMLFGPAGVVIPRGVIMNFLADALAYHAKAASCDHEVVMQAAAQNHLELVFTLDFGSGFTPVYKFSLSPVEVKIEERLQAQILDLQEEMQEMRQQMKKLQLQLAEQEKNCSSHAVPQPSTLGTAAAPSFNNNPFGRYSMASSK